MGNAVPKPTTGLERGRDLDGPDAVLPPWFSNRIKGLIKSPKLHLGDTGGASLPRGDEATARHRLKPGFDDVETSVVAITWELQRSAADSAEFGKSTDDR